jgi:modulator of FtsH protease HflC
MIAMKRNALTLVIGAVLVVVFVLLLFVFQVRQSEAVVITTFGKPTRVITRPGPYLKWPWPIQQVNRFDERIQNFQDRYSESLTADQQNLLTCVYVGWKITDAAEFLRSFRGSVPAAQNRLETILRSAKLQVVGNHPLSDFVNADPKQLKFDQIETEIEQAAQGQLSTNACGMTLEFLGFKKIGLPQDVTQTVFDRMKADRQRLISKWQNDGKAQAQIIESAANRQAANTLANAEAEAIRIKAEGEAEAAKTTLPIFQKNPELANFLLRLDALKSSLNQKSTLIFDERTPPFDLFQHLPTNAPSLDP